MHSFFIKLNDAHQLITSVPSKVKCSRYRSGVTQRVGRGIVLLFHDRGTRKGWVVSSTPRPNFTPGNDPVPIVQEAGWAPGPIWTGGKSRPHRDSIPDRPARSSVAIPIELPGPQCFKFRLNITSIYCKAGVLTPQHWVRYRLYHLRTETGSTLVFI